MISAELMQYLDDQIDDITYDETGTSGNIFDNTLPSSPDLAVKVENSGGFPRDMWSTAYFAPTFRLLVRGGADPREPKELAQEIIDVIGDLSNIHFVPGGARIIKCQAMQDNPISTGRDDEGRHRFSTNFEMRVLNYEAM
ncbi:MAG: minor capsid protein [Candidatus Acetothermia bacterium]